MGDAVCCADDLECCSVQSVYISILSECNG